MLLYARARNQSWPEMGLQKLLKTHVLVIQAWPKAAVEPGESRGSAVVVEGGDMARGGGDLELVHQGQHDVALTLPYLAS